MQFQIAEPMVVETKYDPKYGNLIVLELGPQAHLTLAIPYQHLVKVGDKVSLLADIPLELARLP